MPAKNLAKSRTKHVKKAAVVTPPQESNKESISSQPIMNQDQNSPQIIPDPQATVSTPVQSETPSTEPVSSQVSQLANLSSQNPVAPNTPSTPPQTSTPSTVISPPVSTPPPVLSNSIEAASSKPSKLLWIILIVLLLVGLVVAGTAAYNWSKNSKPSSPETPILTESTPAPTTPPTVTPAASLDKSLISIQVLNGTGEPGLAGKVKTALQTAGFNDISTGNADAYTYSQTTIAIKEDKMVYLQDLLAAVKSLYPKTDTPSTLSATSNYDAIITIGKN